MEIRETVAADDDGLRALYGQAFPDEDLLPLVRALLADTAGTLSLAAVADGRVIGHVVFTFCRVEDDPRPLALLGPLGVLPEFQGQGTGSGLVRAGLERLKKAEVARVYVLGDPAWYGRFGFARDTGAAPPYEPPPEWTGAWQSLALAPGAPATGRLELPEAWRKPEFWGAVTSPAAPVPPPKSTGGMGG